jgi:hypothetical protein
LVDVQGEWSIGVVFTLSKTTDYYLLIDYVSARKKEYLDGI